MRMIIYQISINMTIKFYFKLEIKKKHYNLYHTVISVIYCIILQYIILIRRQRNHLMTKYIVKIVV
jgi:hypothetical protein